MPPRKRKVSVKTNDDVADEGPVDPPNKIEKNAERQRKVQKKQKPTETVTSPQTAEKHVVFKIFTNAQNNEAFHSKYTKELTNQYAKVTFFSVNSTK